MADRAGIVEMAEAVIFDMDGVIFDSERACLECWTKTAAEWQLDDIEKVFRKCIGTNANQTHMIVEEAYASRYGAGIADKLLGESYREFRLRYKDKPLPMKPGVKEILEHLKKSGVPTGLASSTAKAVAEAELKQAGLYDYFDKITGGDSVTISKPDPEIYLIACREMGVRPQVAIAIEDSYNGIRAAHAAGMQAVMVPDMIPADEEMKELCVMICSDLFEVMCRLR